MAETVLLTPAATPAGGGRSRSRRLIGALAVTQTVVGWITGRLDDSS
jgi:hypothetical protein